MIRTAFFAFGISFCLETNVLAGPEVCSGGGPTACVRFDNLDFEPVEGSDYDFDFTIPQAPNIILHKGATAPGGTMYEWRVWSKDAQEAPANIGSITSPGEYNYSVKLLNASGGVGAANVGSISLTPAGDHHSNIVNGSIAVAGQFRRADFQRE